MTFHQSPVSDERPTVVARFNGSDNVTEASSTSHDPEMARFQPLFNQMIDHDIGGAMTEFLFFTPDDEKSIIAGRAWDVVSTSSEYKNNGAFKTVLNHAVKNGLMDLLPPNIKLAENGPGTFSEYMRKTGPLCHALNASNAHEIQSSLILDKSRRYASDAAFGAHRELGIQESIAMVANFMESQTRISEGQGTPVVVTWGFPFANAPESSQVSALDNAQTFFHNMRKQHGHGAQFLIEIDLVNDLGALKKSYSVRPANSKKRKAFGNFILSGFHRAARNGVIQSPNYDTESLWMAKTTVETVHNTVLDVDRNPQNVETPIVRLSAVPRQSHDLNLAGRPSVRISSDDAPRDQILSHKWNEAIYRHLAREAGADKVEFFKKGKKAIMWGEYTRKVA